MCKELTLINRVDLGSRILGYELYKHDTKDIIGKTERQIKKAITDGIIVNGFKLNGDGGLELDTDFVHNLMVKTGVGTLKSANEDNMATLVYTVINKVVNGYEVVSNRFWHGVMPEETLKMYHDIGAVNGIRVTESGEVEVVKAAPIETNPKAAEVKDKGSKKTTTKGK